MTFPKPPFPRARYQTTLVVHQECASPAQVDAFEEAIAKAKATLEDCGGVVTIDHKHEFVGGQAVMAKAKPSGTASSEDEADALPTLVCPVRDAICSTPVICRSGPCLAEARGERPA